MAKHTALFAAALLAALLAAGPAPAVPAPFEILKGSWVGGGDLNFKNGKSEPLACKAYYTSSKDGSALTTALRCSSASGKFELRSHLTYADGTVSGSWEERTYNASGDAAGTLNPNNLRLDFRGGVAGSMTVAFSAASQAISIKIATNDVPLNGIRLNMKRA